MGVFRFFISKIFIRRPILAVGVLALLLMSSYIAFSAARAIFSTWEGYREMEKVNRKGAYIANMDPESEFDLHVPTESLRRVYDYLDTHNDYALYIDGYISELKNSSNMPVPVSYMNKAFNDLNGFSLSEGSGLDFEYDLEDQEDHPITALVGEGLAKDYPIGSVFTMLDPALGRDIVVKVVGVLAPDAARSNYYALNSKQYYNFSIAIPVTRDFIMQADDAFQFNGLMDLIVMNTDRAGVSSLGTYIQQQTGVSFNYYSQEENAAFYDQYFVPSMATTITISGVLLLAIVIVSVWSAMTGVRAMMKDFTINMLVGLSLPRLRGIFYRYYGMLAGASVAAIFVLAAWSRYEPWMRRESGFVTYGLFGLVRMDWLSLLVAALVAALLCVCIVETLMRKIKKTPISIGVLQ